jgi:hypothetical protein
MTFGVTGSRNSLLTLEVGPEIVCTAIVSYCTNNTSTRRFRRSPFFARLEEKHPTILNLADEGLVET